MADSLDPALLLGVPELDRQHQDFFARSDALIHAIRHGASRHEVGRTLAYLRDYAKTHLSAEEALMRDLGYPGVQDHQREHGVFVRDFKALEAEYARDGASPSLILRVSSHLSGWLRQHIRKTDRELAAFLRRRQAP